MNSTLLMSFTMACSGICKSLPEGFVSATSLLAFRQIFQQSYPFAVVDIKDFFISLIYCKYYVM